MPTPGLAAQQHRGPRILGQEAELPLQLAHLGGGAQRFEAVGGQGLEQQPLVQAAEPDLVGHPGGRGHEVDHVHRLGEEILGAQLHRPDGGGEVGLAGQEDHAGVTLLEPFEDLEAVHSRQPQVEHHDLGLQPVVGRQSVLAAQLPRHLVAEVLEIASQGAEDIGIVIDQQDGISHGDVSGLDAGAGQGRTGRPRRPRPDWWPGSRPRVHG